MGIGTLLAAPIAAVIASFTASGISKHSVNEAKEEYANAKNTVGNQSPQKNEEPENKENELSKKETVEKSNDTLYNIAYQNYRLSLNAFLKEQFPGLSKWEPHSEKLLSDEFHKITIIYENGYHKQCMVKPISAVGCIKFAFMDEKSHPSPDPKAENNEDNDEEPVSKPEVPKPENKPPEKVSWLALNLDWLKEQEKICRQKEEDFFVLDEEHSFSEEDDIISLSKQLSYYGMLLGHEDGIYTVSISY